MSRPSNPRNRPRIISAINRGESIKAAAYELGISSGYAYKIAQDLGYVARLVNTSEIKLLQKLRNNK
jgi:molybdenum-dependent DNA-binding transcriptional regulator ModE